MEDESKSYTSGRSSPESYVPNPHSSSDESNHFNLPGPSEVFSISVSSSSSESFEPRLSDINVPEKTNEDPDSVEIVSVVQKPKVMRVLRDRNKKPNPPTKKFKPFVQKNNKRTFEDLSPEEQKQYSAEKSEFAKKHITAAIARWNGEHSVSYVLPLEYSLETLFLSSDEEMVKFAREIKTLESSRKGENLWALILLGFICSIVGPKPLKKHNVLNLDRAKNCYNNTLASPKLAQLLLSVEGSNMEIVFSAFRRVKSLRAIYGVELESRPYYTTGPEQQAYLRNIDKLLKALPDFAYLEKMTAIVNTQ
jgi:hypothetical protein